jgi:hypothetical protein
MRFTHREQMRNGLTTFSVQGSEGREAWSAYFWMLYREARGRRNETRESLPTGDNWVAVFRSNSFESFNSNFSVPGSSPDTMVRGGGWLSLSRMLWMLRDSY